MMGRHTQEARHPPDPAMNPDAPPSKRSSPSKRPSRALPLPLQWLLFGLTAFAVAMLLQFRTGNVPDTDNFYHFGHAAVYAKQGVWWQDFPWATCSVIRTEKADLWWGFHVLLVPFTLIGDPVQGMKLAAACVLAVSLVAVGVALKNAGVRGWFFWPLLLPLTSSDQMWRLLMLRPHVLSLGLMLLLAVLLIRGKNWQIFVCALATAWVHQTVFWMVLALAFAVLLVRFWGQKRQSLLAFGWVLAAVVLAALARPNPLGALRLMRVQIIELSKLLATGYRGADELEPIVPGALLLDNGPFLLGWALSLIALVLFFRRQRTLAPASPQVVALATALLSLVFFELGLFQASRFGLYWIGFGWLNIALTTHLWWQVSQEQTGASKPAWPRPAFGSAMLLGGAMSAWSWVQNGWDMEYQGIPPQRLRSAGEWLQANSAPGQIVFHPDWPMFGELFFWNRHNLYLGGMDPVFQFAHNPSLFWKISNAASPMAPGTTSATRDFKSPEDLHTVLRRDFRADFLIMPAPVHPQLYETLRRDPRFSLQFDQEGVAIFRIAN